MHKNSYPGRFIVFEGLDGSGKTLQAELLAKYLHEEKKHVLLTCEPTLDGREAQKIQDVLEHKLQMDPKGLQKLFSEDRREHLDRIIPELQKGTIVISDRYFFSTFAYGALKVPLEELIAMNEDFILPDSTFVLDLDPKICIERIDARRMEGRDVQAEFFEKEDKLRKVREGYYSLKTRFPELMFIDGDRTPHEIHEDIVTKLKNILE